MQDQRIAALEKQMANKELQWEQEKEKILKALKSERVNRRTSEAEKKALNKELQRVISTLNHGPSPDEEARNQLNLQTTTTQLQELTQQVKAVVTENTDLKKYISSLELKWEEEKWKIIGALNKERTTRCEAQASIKVMEKKLQDETNCLKKKVLDKQEEIEVNQRQWSKLSRKAEKAEKALEECNEFLNIKLDEVVLEQRNLITKTTSERKTLEENNIETEARLKNKEAEIIQREADYKIKLAAVEVQMTGQLAEKDSKVSELEERIKVLIQQTVDLQVSNLHFQELSKKTDKQKAQMKKEAKKVIKEAEKRLAEEKKEKEKKENEFLKTQKKEREAKLKNDIKELKRQAKERKLREKRGE